MKLINPELKSESIQEPDIIPEHLEILKAWIKEQVIAAGANGVDILDLMKARREDKSGEIFWQCFTDEMWLSVAATLAAEYAVMNVVSVVEAEV